ncbi:uncharacterized protein TNCV_3831751 [Trichonephila clavipes]|nr:uncharacterized protein TNCV_3831751 [Trichonephila clavipes]
MALARLRSGHLRSMTFVQGVKSFFTCPCSLLASPAHLLDHWGISLRQLYKEQDLVCESITRKGQMDFWCRLSFSKGIGNNNNNIVTIRDCITGIPNTGIY